MSKLGKEGYRCHFGIFLNGKGQKSYSACLLQIEKRAKNVNGKGEVDSKLQMVFLEREHLTSL